MLCSDQCCTAWSEEEVRLLISLMTSSYLWNYWPDTKIAPTQHIYRYFCTWSQLPSNLLWIWTHWWYHLKVSFLSFKKSLNLNCLSSRANWLLSPPQAWLLPDWAWSQLFTDRDTIRKKTLPNKWLSFSTDLPKSSTIIALAHMHSCYILVTLSRSLYALLL